MSITALFLSKFGRVAAERYIDYELVEAYKGASQLTNYESRINEKGFSESELADFKIGYDAVVEKHGNGFKKPYGWAAPFLQTNFQSFSAIEEAVDMDHWRPYYKWASQNIHANAKSIRVSLGMCEAVDEVILVGPSNSGMTDPGHSTALSLTQLTSALTLHSANIDELITMKIVASLSEEIGNVLLNSSEKIMTQDDLDN